MKWPAEARIDPERLKRAAESAEKRGALPGLWARLSDQAAFDEYEALRCVTVNGRRPESKADFAVVAAEAARRAALAKLEARWNALMNADGTLPFSSFGAERPEREALRWAPALRKALDWWSAAGSRAEPYAEECGFNPAEIFATSFRDPDPVRRLKLRRAATNLLMPLQKALERRSALLALFAEKREALDALAPQRAQTARLGRSRRLQQRSSRRSPTRPSRTKSASHATAPHSTPSCGFGVWRRSRLSAGRSLKSSALRRPAGRPRSKRAPRASRGRPCRPPSWSACAGATSSA